MTVAEAFVFDTHVSESSLRTRFFCPEGRASALKPIATLERAIALNSSAEIEVETAPPGSEGGEARYAFKGNPTEGALLALLVDSFGYDYAGERAAAEPLLVARRPFSKEAKFMSSLYAAVRHAS